MQAADGAARGPPYVLLVFSPSSSPWETLLPSREVSVWTQILLFSQMDAAGSAACPCSYMTPPRFDEHVLFQSHLFSTRIKCSLKLDYRDYLDTFFESEKGLIFPKSDYPPPPPFQIKLSLLCRGWIVGIEMSGFLRSAQKICVFLLVVRKLRF